MSSRDTFFFRVDFLVGRCAVSSWSDVFTGDGVGTSNDGFHPFSDEIVGGASDGGLNSFTFRVKEDDLADS